MAKILPFSNYDGLFDPKDVMAMWMALDDVCKTLDLPDGPPREVIAERIVALARKGFRSRIVLRNRVLHEADQGRRIAV